MKPSGVFTNARLSKKVYIYNVLCPDNILQGFVDLHYWIIVRRSVTRVPLRTISHRHEMNFAEQCVHRLIHLAACLHMHISASVCFYRV